MSELGLSDSDSDSSVGSILGARLDGFDRESWMLDTKGAHCDIQVGEAVGVNDSGDIPRRMTGCRVGVEVVPRAQVAKPGVESRKQPSSTLSGKTVTINTHGLVIGKQDDGGGRAEGVGSVRGDRQDGGGAPLTPDDKKEKRRWQNQKKRARKKPSPSQKDSRTAQPGGNRKVARTKTLLDRLSRLQSPLLCFIFWLVPKVQYEKTLQFVCLCHIPLKVVLTLTEGITCWMSPLHFRV